MTTLCAPASGDGRYTMHFVTERLSLSQMLWNTDHFGEPSALKLEQWLRTTNKRLRDSEIGVLGGDVGAITSISLVDNTSNNIVFSAFVRNGEVRARAHTS